jgi:predicted homoserine dehydrogenase-like protein
MYLYDELRALEHEGKRIRIGLVGAGFMGRGIVETVRACPGMTVTAVADIDPERVRAVFEEAGETAVVEVDSDERSVRGEKNIARVKDEQPVVTSSPRVIAQLESVDMVIEATGDPEIGAEVAYFGIMHGKHVGMLNVETDVTIGPQLNRLAKRAGVVYTVCAGDEPAAIKDLCDFARLSGLTIVACGKGKNNPLDLNATPDGLAEKAGETGLNPKILTEFVDGTKTMVEMSCVANATGLSVDRRNMHGPVVSKEKLPQVFSLQKEGGILEHEGVVDYTIGDLAPGVFAVVRPNGPVADEMMQYLHIGVGPNYLLYRPYHLTSLEVADSISRACLYGRPTIAPLSGLRTEVITIAKKNLEQGERIDGIGGFTIRGGVERFEEAKKQKLLPLGLAKGAVLNKDVQIGTPLRWDDVVLRDSLLLHLRKLQDSVDG